jgi:hypothetical protein
MQSNYDGSTHRRYKATKSFSSYDPPNLEHEAIGRVCWVKSTICVNILLSTRGAQTLELYKIILASYQDLRLFEAYYKVDCNPIFSSNTNGLREPDNILQCIPRNRDPFPWPINKVWITHNPNSTTYYK